MKLKHKKFLLLAGGVVPLVGAASTISAASHNETTTTLYKDEDSGVPASKEDILNYIDALDVVINDVKGELPNVQNIDVSKYERALDNALGKLTEVENKLNEFARDEDIPSEKRSEIRETVWDVHNKVKIMQRNLVIIKTLSDHKANFVPVHFAGMKERLEDASVTRAINTSEFFMNDYNTQDLRPTLTTTLLENLIMRDIDSKFEMAAMYEMLAVDKETVKKVKELKEEYDAFKERIKEEIENVYDEYGLDRRRLDDLLNYYSETVHVKTFKTKVDALLAYEKHLRDEPNSPLKGKLKFVDVNEPFPGLIQVLNDEIIKLKMAITSDTSKTIFDSLVDATKTNVDELENLKQTYPNLKTGQEFLEKEVALHTQMQEHLKEALERNAFDEAIGISKNIVAQIQLMNKQKMTSSMLRHLLTTDNRALAYLNEHSDELFAELIQANTIGDSAYEPDIVDIYNIYSKAVYAFYEAEVVRLLENTPDSGGSSNKIRQLEAKLRELGEQRDGLLAENESFGVSIRQLNSENEEKNRTINNKNQRISELESQLEALRNQLNANENKVNKLEVILSDIENMNLNSEHERALSVINKFNNRVNELLSTIDEKEADAKETLKELNKVVLEKQNKEVPAEDVIITKDILRENIANFVNTTTAAIKVAKDNEKANSTAKAFMTSMLVLFTIIIIVLSALLVRKYLKEKQSKK